jgi:nucleotide-binding universal stress UspA family protein
MYKHIHVPLDNSDHSNAAMQLGVALGEAFDARLVGSHVYAAKLHDVRFKQMEITLPEEYKEEGELEKQRKIHDALIARGLHLISDSYLDQMAVLTEAKGMNFERKHFDGRNFEALVGDIQEDDYDLLVLGALGQGAVRDSQVGSVCERILRRTEVDTLVIRNPDVASFDATGKIAVALDGSAQSYGALQGALALAAKTGKDIEIVTVVTQDAPDAELLGQHLAAAVKLAEAAGVKATAQTLIGDTVPALVAYAEQESPWLIALGRVGIDTVAEDDVAIGSTVDNLLRVAPVNLLVASQTWTPSATAQSTAQATAK